MAAALGGARRLLSCDGSVQGSPTPGGMGHGPRAAHGDGARARATGAGARSKSRVARLGRLVAATGEGEVPPLFVE